MVLNIMSDYKKYRENKVFKGIWLSKEESESWDAGFIRGMLNGKTHVFNSNGEYVKQLESIVKQFLLNPVFLKQKFQFDTNTTKIVQDLYKEAKGVGSRTDS